MCADRLFPAGPSDRLSGPAGAFDAGLSTTDVSFS